MFDMFGGNRPEDPEGFDEEAEFQRAVDLAGGADVAVVVVGEWQNMIGEAASRSSLELPGRQLELLQAVVATGTPVVLLVMNGRPLDLRWAAEHVPAILDIWYPGTRADRPWRTCCSVMSRPAASSRSPGRARRAGADGLRHTRSHEPDNQGRAATGTRPHAAVPVRVRLELRPLRVRQPRRRSPRKHHERDRHRVGRGHQHGGSSGDEVVQLYIHQRSGTASRPVRELKGFPRVTLAARESRTVQFPIGPDERRYWNAAGTGCTTPRPSTSGSAATRPRTSTPSCRWSLDATPRRRSSMTSRIDRIAVVLAAVAAAQPAPAAPPGTEVRTTSGVVAGAVANGVVSWKGIPFAEPPVGELRWRPPQPVKPWTGVKKTTEDGHDCAQLPFPGDAAPLGTPPAEDCLYINVWAPANAGAQLPVMFWIHGGGFVNGGSSASVYDGGAVRAPRRRARQLQLPPRPLRLLRPPALTEERPTASRQVRLHGPDRRAAAGCSDNIAAFGGDPGNVTIFGESAGGVSVNTLLTLPPRQGPLPQGHRRIRRRPRRHLPRRPGSRRHAAAEGVVGSPRDGITGEDAAALAALRALPAEEVVNGLNMMTMGQEPTPTRGRWSTEGRHGGIGDRGREGRPAKVPS